MRSISIYILLSKKEGIIYYYLYEEEGVKQIIRGLLEGFQEWEIPHPIERGISFPDFPPEVRKVHVLMGVRRSGKTWVLYRKMRSLMEKGLDKKKILYLNFEDDRLIHFSSKDFQAVLDAYFDLNPEFVKSNDLVFFFDEIHLVAGWEKFIRRLIDQEKMQLYITGSSAQMLSSEIATTLRGRGWPQEVFPCSFVEYAVFNGWDKSDVFTPKRCSQLRHWASEYLISGGFPEGLFLSKELHSALLQNYVNTVVFRDVVERHQVKNVHVVKLFLMHCLHQLAAPLSVNKTFNRFKSQGLTVGKNSLYDYLGYFEDAYAIFCVPIFDFSEQVRQINPKKIYAVDTGLITAYSIKSDFEIASRLENAVFLTLRRKQKDIFYYRTKKQQEVDFVVMTPKGNLVLYQVCHDISASDTRTREFQALINAAIELNLKDGYIITGDHEEIIEADALTLYCIPFWKWALSEG